MDIFVHLHKNICNAIHLQTLLFYFDIIQKKVECVSSFAFKSTPYEKNCQIQFKHKYDFQILFIFG
jgi:hypothetical protein